MISPPFGSLRAIKTTELISGLAEENLFPLLDLITILI
jgi:hypothetical protein